MSEDKITVSQEAIDYLCKQDGILGAFIKKTGPLSRGTLEDPYLSTLDCILAQQVSGKAAQSIGKKVFARFPNGDPQAILDAQIEDMRTLGLSGSKAAYLKNVAQTKLDGSVKWDQLQSMDTQDIIDALLPIKGVGLWTVQMVLIFSLKKMDVMSYDDLAIRRGIMRLYHLEKVSKDFFAELYQKTAPYQTYASFYLWEASLSKENIPFPIV
ncbi:MAG: methylated-DNA-protein-cysteine S-methyltransferase [Erysipelotrichaceae bacterium]|nr:MAG: methylated-DNA-protein-cysteine [Erysipelotrichaceae bacterium]TXT19594.1 MAG: methylated-DNA-protein-cysteine S-methyltransferase [Erysipelotrichaceae bacterium]